MNTVKAVWNNYPAVAHQFKTASEDTSRNDTEKKKFLGLHKHLTHSGFLMGLDCMKDILHELQRLPLKLQWRDMSLVDATSQILQTTDVLTAMKESGGKSTLKAEQRTSLDPFKNVQLVEGRGKISQFYQSVIDGIKRQMPESDLVYMLKPLDNHFWPDIGTLKHWKSFVQQAGHNSPPHQCVRGGGGFCPQ